MSSTLIAPELQMQQSPGGRLKMGLRKILRSREIGVLAALIVLVLVVSILRYPSFLTEINMFNLTRQIAFTAIVAIGVLFVIITGGVDLSLGSTVGLTGFMCGVAVSMWHAPPLLAVIIGVATGAAVGAFNGSIVAYIGVTPFIVTLGMLTAGRSIIYQIFNGANITDVPDVFSAVGNGSLLGLPIPVVILLLVGLVCHVVLTYTTFGRRIYAIGGNEEATHLSGINVKAVKFFAYVVCSSLCSITGLLYVGRFRSAVANAGVGLELDAIAAAVIGGTSLMGGTGSVLGVLIGACIMGVVSNAITLLEIRSEAQGMIIGGIIIAAAILDVVRTRKTSLAAHVFVFIMGVVVTSVLLLDYLGVVSQVRVLYMPLIPAFAALVTALATLAQFTSGPRFSSFLYFLRIRLSPTVGAILVALGAFVVYLFTVNTSWALGLLATALIIYLVLTAFDSLIHGKPANPQVQRVTWQILVALSAALCLYFVVILIQDFVNDRTIQNSQRLSTLLILATIGTTAGLAYSAARALGADSGPTRESQ